MPRPLISLLTDFGLRDPSAAIMRGVILGIAPDAELLDISHEVRKYRIRDGALLLWCALPYLPVGIHVAVVDPGVGTARRAVALRTARGDVLVGPDNGLLLPATDRLGGIVGAAELRDPAYRLPVVSSSFHGRDIFAPAAAHLATGVAIEALGPQVDPATLVRLPIPDPIVAPGELRAHVLYVDTFGNVKLTALAPDLPAALGPLNPGDPLSARVDGRPVGLTWRTTFGDAAPGEPLLYEDSYGRLCVAVNQGDAAAALGLVEDQAIAIARRS
jgi:S-adenosylmethionine hydrolase